jgi:protein arginine kinase activator
MSPWPPPAAAMICEHCNKFPASVRVTDIVYSDEQSGEGGSAHTVQERLLCEMCAHSMQLPKTPVGKTPLNIFQMLHSARRTRRRNPVACAACGMDLDDFRRRGRLGCPACYETFRAQVGELLERVHGARTHVGRVPGVGEEELQRLQTLADLRQELDVAIREEDYESAARLRDRIQALEAEAAPHERA